MSQNQGIYFCESIDFETYSSLIKGWDHPLYFSPWWLKIIENYTADASLFFVGVKNASVFVAVFVALQQDFQIITPNYCQTLGLFYLDKSLSIRERQMIALSLVQNIPKVDFFHLNFSTDYKDWLPWFWSSYEQTTRYNYVLNIEGVNTEDDFMQSISRKLRKRLRSALKAKFLYTDQVLLEEALDIFRYNSDYKGYKANYLVLEELIKGSLKRGLGQLVGVKTEADELVMVSYIVRHGERAYFIAGGCKRELAGKYQVRNILLMNYILNKDESLKLLDFEGSMLKPIASLYQGLGANQEAYFTIKRGFRYSPRIILSKLTRFLKFPK